MIIVDRYSFNNGESYINENHLELLHEIEEVVSLIDANTCMLKEPKSEEIKRAQRAGVTHFYSPPHINALFDYFMFKRGWSLKPRIKTNDPSRKDGFREMDFIKGKFGVEVQMGKYSFLTYDIVAKMVIFRNLGIVECGVEICPMAAMLPYMSSGIGAFEQVKWDLEARGADKSFDVPVLVLGIMPQTIYSNRQSAQIPLFPNSGYKPPTILLERYSKLPKTVLSKVKETGIDPEN